VDQPAQGLVVDVVPGALAIGPILAVAADGAQNGARLSLAERLVTHAEAVHHPWPETLHDHVEALEQL
jgi:hypothetical protein